MRETRCGNAVPSRLVDMYTNRVYNHSMIRSFADKETEKIYKQVYSKRLPVQIQKTALRKLILLDNAKLLSDLRIPPANHLELLHGDRSGQYSIRINDQFRICFRFEDGDAFDVGIVDYH